MNVFAVLEKFIEDVKTKYQDNVIFSKSDELLIVSPVEGDIFEYMIAKAKETGFLLDVKQEDKQISGKVSIQVLKFPLCCGKVDFK